MIYSVSIFLNIITAILGILIFIVVYLDTRNYYSHRLSTSSVKILDRYSKLLGGAYVVLTIISILFTVWWLWTKLS